MLPLSGKKIILFYVKEDEAWKQRLQDRLVSRINDTERFPEGLSIEAWNDQQIEEMIHDPPRLQNEMRNAVYMLFLVSDDLLKSPYFRDLAGMLQLSLGQPSTFRMLRVHLRPLVFSLDWLESTMLVGPEDPPLADLPREQCDVELDRIADVVVVRAAAAINMGSSENSGGPDASNDDHVPEKAHRLSGFSPDGNRIVSGRADNTLRLWDARTGQPVGEPLRGHENVVFCVAFSPDGSRIVSGSFDETLRLWDAKTGRPIGVPLRGHHRVFSVAFSPDGSRIVSASEGKILRLWDVSNGTTGHPIGEPLRGHEWAVLSVAFSPDGSRIVSGSLDNTLRLWDARTAQPIGEPLRGHKMGVESVAFSPDGRRIVSGSEDNTLRLWDARTGQPIGEPLHGHEMAVWSVVFSPDGSRIVSGSEDNTLRLWDARTGQPIGEPLRGHEMAVRSVAFSPDGSRIVSGGMDSTLWLWDARAGQPIGAPLRGHEKAVRSVAFSPDGSRIVSGSADHTLRLWDARTGQPIGASLHRDAGDDGYAAEKIRRLSGFNTDRPGGEDLLGIQDEVNALAVLIAARTVVPPLSIGLFGEWGSGKTFFMRQLRNAIDELAKEARTANRMQRDLPIYKNIVQIEFNAWHYVEGNLWASLVEHILDNLYPGKEASVSQTLQKELIGKLAEEKALSLAASNAVDSAKAAATVAKGDLEDAQRNLDEKTKELAKLNAEHVGKDFLLAGAHQPVLDALKQLNLTAVGGKAVELEGALRQIHGVLGRGQRFLAPLMHAEDRDRRFAWLFLSLLGVPSMTILVRFVLQMLGSSVADIYAYAAGLATLIGSGVPWLRQQAEWMSRRLDEAEAAQKKFDEEMAKQSAVHVQKVTQAEQKLRELTTALDAAQQKHAEAKAREAAADAELRAATAGRLLANFITDRAASSDYRKHLGVLALVRDDFEKLSGLIEEDNWALSPEDPLEPPSARGQQRYASLAEEEKDKDKRINRIVLYIDDLDRCPPNKVVEVLQAVHLLLAFPLFVVVVGVDARWIKRSLQARYHQLLHVSGKSPDGEDHAGLLLGSATPNDYLEKIFQIPFWLRPMEASACDRMVRGLLQTSIKHPDEGLEQTARSVQPVKEPAPEQAYVEQTPAPAAAAKEEKAASIQEGSSSQDLSRSPSAATATPSASAVVGKDTDSAPVLQAVYPAFKSLETTQEELDFMSRLAPVLGRSPRALKRFVNVYRLIKTGLTVHEARSFLQPNETLADYQAVLFLLAVDTGMPLLAREFFSVMEEGMRAASPDEAPANIAWMVNRMNAMIQSDTLRESGSWRRMRDWLDNRLGATRSPVAADTPLSVFTPWMQRVARFSFELGRS
jgi:WD40 repeat protein